MTGGGIRPGRGGTWRRVLLIGLGVPSALAAGVALLALGLGVFGGGSPGPGSQDSFRQFEIPSGTSFRAVGDTLEARGLVKSSRFFTLYARMRGADREVKSGPYEVRTGASWAEILRIITEGRVLTERVTIPEGFRLSQIAERLSGITELPPDTILERLTGDSMDQEWGVPGPGLEGYLFPDTYRVAQGAPLENVIAAMIGRYRAFWTPERVARRDSLGLSERELVTLASIVQAEAGRDAEMALISAVYHNRLERGQLLQADPTVLYALGGHRARLLYAAMDSVADHPYNTYTQPGLPPGPIGAPGLNALDAALHPADSDFLYFVAHPDGTHIFSRTLAEHNRAVARVRPEWDRYRREQRQGSQAGSGEGRD